MRSFALCRPLFALLACAASLPAAAGNPVQIELVHKGDCGTPNTVFWVAAVSQPATPGGPVYVDGTDAAGSAVRLTLVDSNATSAHDVELRGMYNLLRAAVQLAQQDPAVIQGMLFEDATCENTYDIAVADWSFGLRPNGSAQFQFLLQLTIAGLEIPVGGYVVGASSVSVSDTGGRLVLTMRDASSLASRILHGVGVVGNIRNGWRYLYMISAAGPDAHGIYRDPSGQLTRVLVTDQSR